MNVDEALLDDPARISEADTAELLPQAASAARQVRQSWRLAQEADVGGSLAADGRPRAILVVGLGASAMAASVLEAVIGARGPVPVVSHHGHGLPGWAGVADLVLAVSATGMEPQTCSAVEEARRRGCRLAVVSPANTPMSDLAARARAPFVVVPEVRPAWAALWSLSVPLLAACRGIGLVREGDQAVEATARRLEEMATRCRPASESFVNPAKLLALELAGTIPMFWGTSHPMAVVAERATSQLAATARYPALAGELPRSAYDQAALFVGAFGAGAGSADSDDFFRDRVEDEEVLRLRLVLLRDSDAEQPEVGRQADAAAELAAESGMSVTELRPEGVGVLERLASLICLVDYASIYLSLALGVDASRTPMLHQLGRR